MSAKRNILRILSPKYYYDHIRSFSQYTSSRSWMRKYSHIAPLKGIRTAKILSHYVSSHAKVLDLGCGTGLTFVFVAQFFPKAIACDIGKKEITATRKILKDHGLKNKVIVYDGKKLPFPDNYFDAVSFIEVIEHVEDAENVLREIQRILKPNGILHITTANKLWPIEPHFGLLFLSYLPNFLADMYVRAAHKGNSYENIHLPTYVEFYKQVNKYFIVEDITFSVIGEYKKYGFDKERGNIIILAAHIFAFLKRFENMPIASVLIRWIFFLMSNISLGWLFIGTPRKRK